MHLLCIYIFEFDEPLDKRLGLFTILMESISITIGHGVQEEADKGGLQGSALKFTYAIGILVYTTIGGTIFTIAKISDKSDAKSKRKRKYSKCDSHCRLKN